MNRTPDTHRSPSRTDTARSSTWEYREITLPRGTSRSEARQALTEQAEYGKWELARVRLYVGGTRRITLRRRIIRMVRQA